MKKYILISLIIVTMFLVGCGEEFDEDKHVCEEVKHSITEDITLVSDIFGFDGSIADANRIALRHECTGWRDKTECELNPETEGCVCDEPIYLSTIDDTECLNVTNNKDGFNCVIKDDEYGVVYTRLNKVCISAHDKTIVDYNCSFIYEQIVRNNDYSVGTFFSDEGFFHGGTNLILARNALNSNELMDVFKEQGCEI